MEVAEIPFSAGVQAKLAIGLGGQGGVVGPLTDQKPTTGARSLPAEVLARRGGGDFQRGVKLVVPDAHEGLRWRSCGPRNDVVTLPRGSDRECRGA